MDPKKQKNKKVDKPEIAEETRQAKRARIRGNPELQKRWDHHLQRLDYNHGKSFLNAVSQAYQTNTNMKSPGNHKLWRLAGSGNTIDLDWGVWMVLRITYYDVNINEQDEKQLGQRLAFKKGAVTKRIKERYPDIEVLSTDFPETFPERPSFWPKLGTKAQPAKPRKTQEEQLSAVAPVEQPTQTGEETEPPAGNTQPASGLGDDKPRTPLPDQVQLTSIILPRKRTACADRGDVEDEPGDDDHPPSPNKRLRRDIAPDDAPSLVSSGQQLPDSLLNAPVAMSYEESERSVNNWGRGYGQPNAGPLNTRAIKREINHSPVLPSIETSGMQQIPMTNQPVQPARPLTTRVESDVFNPPGLPNTASGNDIAKQTLAELIETKRDIGLLRARVEMMGAMLLQARETRFHGQTEAAGARRRIIASLCLRGLVAMVASVVAIKLMEEGLI
ncbi:hypothetical protein FDECE_1572 [Fusarium decemcellulare]|nr:hypothetical protein FDECE_1572 [Fusarium decemcellulare]